MIYLYFIFAVSLLSLAVAGLLARKVFRADTGNKEMRDISEAIKEGAEAFLRRQNRTIALMSLVLVTILFLFYQYSESPNIRELGQGIALKVAAAFLVGAICSMLSGFIGMYTSIRANLRTAVAATRSLDGALRMALHGGAVSGLSVVALSLLGVGGIFYLFGGAFFNIRLLGALLLQFKLLSAMRFFRFAKFRSRNIVHIGQTLCAGQFALRPGRLTLRIFDLRGDLLSLGLRLFLGQLQGILGGIGFALRLGH